MNVSVMQFTGAPAMVGRSRSFWHEIIDTVIEGSPRTAANESPNILSGTSTICRRHYGLSSSAVTCAYKRREGLLNLTRVRVSGAFTA